LRIASEKQAYVLTDIATLILTNNVDLKALFYKDEILKNIYSVCLVSEKIIGKKRYNKAEGVFSYLTSKEALSKIREFSESHSKKGYPPIFEPVYGEK
jgi:ABC-type tungstate transport system permease subunit